MTGNAFASGSILVPLDGSELAERALPYAAALAPALQRPIVLMIATYTPEVWNRVPVAGNYEATAHAYCVEYLERVGARLESLDVRTDVRDGFGREQILDAVHDHGASLIVATSHGRSGITRWAYGSTASHLAHQSEVPILVVGRGALAQSNPVSIKRIMVPLDGSTLAEAALPFATELGGAFGARVTLVRVVPWAAQAYPYGSPSTYADIDAELESMANAYLSKVSRKLESSVNVDDILLRGFAADALTQFVDEQATDLVVMTTHARVGLQRAVLGSTADRMLQGRAPVLLIRPRDQDGAHSTTTEDQRIT